VGRGAGPRGRSRLGARPAAGSRRNGWLKGAWFAPALLLSSVASRGRGRDASGEISD
jgi:hypothetical protein